LPPGAGLALVPATALAPFPAELLVPPTAPAPLAPWDGLSVPAGPEPELQANTNALTAANA
jgi:hypothetical protein